MSYQASNRPLHLGSKLVTNDMCKFILLQFSALTSTTGLAYLACYDIHV